MFCFFMIEMQLYLLPVQALGPVHPWLDAPAIPRSLQHIDNNSSLRGMKIQRELQGILNLIEGGSGKYFCKRPTITGHFFAR